ncbi:MAG: hypothetical protein ABIN20_05925, partial [candidate division WOR-3 bacterium]
MKVSIFPNCPKNCSKLTVLRKGEEEKLILLEQNRLKEPIEESKQEYLKHRNSIKYKSYNEFLKVFRSFNFYSCKIVYYTTSYESASLF